MLGRGRRPHRRSPGRRPPMRSRMLAAQHRPPCGRSSPGRARLCSAPPARRSARSACAAAVAPPPTRRSRSARPRDPSRTPPGRPRCHTPGHACDAQPRSRALEAASHTPTLPLTHRAPGNVTHTLSTFTLSRCHSFVRGQSGSNLRTVCHTQSFVVFSSLECACRVIHCDTHSDIATTNSDTHISPVVSHVVTNTVNSALQGHTLITHIQPPPQ